MRRLRSLPIQLRITLGSLLVSGLVLVGVAGLLAFQIRSTTAASEQTLAESDLAPFISDLQNNPDETPDKPAAGILVAIREQSGAFLRNTLPDELQAHLADRDLHDHAFVEAGDPDRDSQAPTRRVTSAGTTYVVVEEHITTREGQFTLWAARSTASGDLTIMALDRSLVVGLVVAFLAFGGASWLLSSLSLRPVRRLADSALQISRDDSRDALPVSRAGDELSVLAETLNAFIARLRSSADHERQIVSDASHELRTPIAALTARLELAHRSFGDADALEREIVAAEASVARLSDLATTLLELSRLDQRVGESGERPRSTAGELTRELLDAVDRTRISPTASGIGIDFVVDDIADPESAYPISAASFGRICDNLLVNAVTFSPSGGTVRATFEQEGAEEDDPLLLTVTDEGPGLPADFIAHAFDRFSRADDSRRRVRGGSGLGLALVRGLAEQAGGTAEIDNRDTTGAVATVRIPKM
ncbi:HAMP domain-containing sensor histidine kinase [Frondihabitans cladoniiphilus]|uniref:histidine kinase n=1 Tax=Frondihabitans cladoniiphilus TaxID=715785 RepID=A0ABP8VJD3_9MICO